MNEIAPSQQDSSQPLSARQVWLLSLGFLALTLVIRLALAAFSPITLDEAYYAAWAGQLDWGYFDHPPMVAWLTTGQFVAPLSSIGVRLGTVFVSGLTVLVLGQWFYTCGLRHRLSWTLAMILGLFNAAAIIAGFLTTPDAVLIFCWSLGLWQAALGLTRDRRYWLGAGFACGLGILSKYTIIVIALVFLWALWRGDRKALKTPWPYLGAVLSLVVAFPHFIWASNNDWISMKFQLRHRFASEIGELMASDLPRPQKFIENSPEHQLAKPFLLALEESKKKKPKKKKRQKSYPEKVLHRLQEFIGGQLTLWGALAFPIIFALFSNRKTLFKSKLTRGFHPRVTPLVMGGTWIPIGFFALFTLQGKVEANWSAMFLVAAAALVAPLLLNIKRPGMVLIAAALNVLLVTTISLHSRNIILPTPPHKDRVLKETHGFADLASYLRTIEAPIFAERYQLVAMLKFYSQRQDIQQWPGLTRPSEFLRRQAFQAIDHNKLESAGGFYLISSQLIPPRLQGFVPKMMVELRDCPGRGLIVSEPGRPLDTSESCEHAIHTWFLISYQIHSREAS